MNPIKTLTQPPFIEISNAKIQIKKDKIESILKKVVPKFGCKKINH